MNKKLWTPSEEWKRNSNMMKYMEYLKRKGLDFKSYNKLYKWSIDNREKFWQSIWEFAGIIFSKNYERILDNGEDMMKSRWFAGARFNFAENLLRNRGNRIAIVFQSEVIGRETREISYEELYNEVAKVALGLKNSGVGIGDRVAGVMPNMPESVIAMLGVTTLGAVWTSCAADFGLQSILDRLEQIKPKILFITDGYFLNGKKFDLLPLVPKITEKISSIEKVVVLPYVDANPEAGNFILYRDFIFDKEGLEIKFEQLPFEHPVYIVYTSGTTGKPKCIVHSAGGMLLQHFKEIALHSNLKKDDRMFYVTTCGWVLWNWMVSSLMLGSTLILRDGAPFFPDAEALFRFIEEQGITHFGVGARFIESVKKLGLKPKEKYDLSKLKVVMYGGSALSEEGYEYTYREINDDLMISSMAGGTEIASCFAIGNPLDDVYAGQIQGWGLGMKCEVFNQSGEPVFGEKGELVCTASFPCQPVRFWDDLSN